MTYYADPSFHQISLTVQLVEKSNYHITYVRIVILKSQEGEV